jgi:dinuclear metal center YbgI/SA1388 family protein
MEPMTTTNNAAHTVSRDDLERSLNNLLAPEHFKDYGPNGLQVQGADKVHLLVSGVTASLAFIEAALEAGADALLVHHGLFWRGQDGRLTGWLGERVRRLMRHGAQGVSLLAYHLPLDAHPELGNNAQLGLGLGLRADARFGDQDLGFAGPSGACTSTAVLADVVARSVRRAPIVVPGDGRPLRRIGWCTGGAQGFFEAAIAAGVDAFVTGEISEPQAHLARETGVAYLACGHHASERFGAPAVGAHVAAQLGIAHRFIDIENPA